MKKVVKCCFCGRFCRLGGCMPYPVVFDDYSRCCYDCNEKIVLPARLASYKDEEDVGEYELSVSLDCFICNMHLLNTTRFITGSIETKCPQCEYINCFDFEHNGSGVTVTKKPFLRL
jgi:phage FluMu protein Com